jgi:hypothetical protein
MTSKGRFSALATWRNDVAQCRRFSSGMQNHKSNAKSALLYLAREKGVPEHGAPLMEEWEALKAKIEGSLVRHRLSSFMRF